MKNILLAIVAGLLLAPPAPAAIQTLPFTDHFAYSNGNLATVAPGVWDISGQTGPEQLVTNAAALSGPTGFAASSGAGVKWTPSGTARRAIVQFSAISSNTPGAELYASFLVNLTSVSATKLFAYFDNSTSQPSSPQLGIFAASGSIGIGKKATAPAASVTVGSGTHLVVVRYTFVAGANDTADLWVDPTNTSYSAATPPAPHGSTSGGTDPASIPYFGIYSVSGAGPTLFLDEVRIGTNWADVVPGTPPPPPPSAPTITQVSMTEQGFVLEGVGGASNGLFNVLASVDITDPMANWAAIGSYNFDANGNFSVTNPVPEGTEAEFFALYIPDTSTNTPPTITAQPQNQQVLEGQAVQFSVTATGSQPLRYQWFFNTNTVLAAGTNATYTISSVSSNDVGSYSVLVSNTAGSVTSVVAFLSLGEPVTNGTYYVSPTGNDSNPGTYNQPFWNLQKALNLAQPGDTIYMRGGTFLYVSTLRVTNSGTALAPINLWAYPGEQPVLNFSGQATGDSNRGMLITTAGNYWNFKGLEVAYAGDNGIKVEGSHHRFEQCVFHHNRDTGLQIGFGHTNSNPGGVLAAYIEVVNCDSYLNYDPATNGGNADGFAAKMHCGQGIVFTGCRAWENSDDGWDLFETDYSVVISNCWTWKSGVGQGNGNGFKLGGNGTGGDSKGTHYAFNCVSFGHKVNCFTQNSHKDGLVLINCLGFSPGASGYNFFMEGSLNSGKTNIFINNASIPRSGANTGGFIADNTRIELNNSWNLPVTVNSADFVTLAETAAKAPRKPDGSLPDDFARLVAGSDLINKGVDAGLPYCEAAPDLGAFEYCP
jgi:hypothetical protein